MFTLRKSFRFEAAHRLPDHDGKCARLHGHSWVATVEVGSYGLQREGPKAGMVLDYGDLKAIVQPIVDDLLDHHHLNETLADKLDGLPPTSEAIARWLFREVKRRGPGPEHLLVLAVEVDETCTSRCRYQEP